MRKLADLNHDRFADPIFGDLLSKIKNKYDFVCIRLGATTFRTVLRQS